LRIVTKQKRACDCIRKKNAKQPQIKPLYSFDIVINLFYELQKVIQLNKVIIVEGDVSVGE